MIVSSDEVTRSPSVGIVRAYDATAPSPGVRVLIDGLWPRGVRKAALELHSWERDIAPSAELRKWFGHDPDRFAEFRARYLEELKEPHRAEALARLRELARGHGLVIVTATSAVEISHAEVIRGLLSRPAATGVGPSKARVRGDGN